MDVLRCCAVLSLVIRIFASASSPCTSTVNPHNGACYWIETPGESWREGLQSCQAEGGTIATVESPDVQSFIATDVINGYSAGANLWIGASDGIAEGTPRWTSTRPLSWTDWESDQPDGQESENCISLHLSGTVWGWQDNDCSTLFDVICQLPAENCSAAEHCFDHSSVEWTVFQDSCIWLNDNATYTGVATLEECQRLCVEAVDFLCKSIEYISSSLDCLLSNSKNDDATVTFFSVCPSTPGVVFYERVFPAGPIQCPVQVIPAFPYNFASGICRSMGGYVMTFFDEGEALNYFNDYWIGLTDIEVEGVFKWDDAYGTYPTYAHFDAGTIATSGEASKDCVATYPTPVYPYYWQNVDCAGSRATMCMKTPHHVCAVAPDIANSDKVINDTVTTFTCHEGYTFPSGNTVEVVVCDCSLMWSTKTTELQQCNLPVGTTSPESSTTTETEVSTQQLTTVDLTTAEQTTTAEITTEETTAVEPTTEETTTAEITTEETTTAAKTTEETTIAETTTEETTTAEITTEETTIAETTTEETTTAEITTEETTTAELTNEETTTSDLTTEESTTAELTIEETTTAEVTTEETTTAELTTQETTTAELTTEETTTAEVTTGETTTAELATEETTTAEVTTEESTTRVLTTNQSTDAELTTESVATADLTTADLTTAAATSQQSVAEPTTTVSPETITTQNHNGGFATTNNVVLTSARTGVATVGSTSVLDGTTIVITTDYQSTFPSNDSTLTTDILDVTMSPPYEQPPSASHADVEKLDWDTYLYTCHYGFQFLGGGSVRTVVRLPTGMWSSYDVACQETTCSLPIGQDDSIYMDYSHMTRIQTIQCPDDTYLMQGEQLVDFQCSALGSWHKTPSSCEQSRCSALPQINNAKIGSYTADVSTSWVVNCLPGYRFPAGGAQTLIHCDANGTWSDIGHCQVNRCPAAELPPHSRTLHITSDVGSLLEVTCDPGYVFPDNTTLRILECLASEMWNDTVPNCTVRHCPEFLDVFNATTSGSGHVYGTIITVTCFTGYRLEDGHKQKDVMCGANGEWEEQTLSCEDMRCPPLSTIRHSTPSTTQAIEGNVVKVTCNPGHSFSDGSISTNIICHNRVWNISTSACQVVRCPDEPYVMNAYVNATGHVYNSTANVTCHPGYTFGHVDNLQARCLQNGSWSHTGNCDVKKCPDPPDVVLAIRDVTVNSSLGQVVQYTCVHGYSFYKRVREMTLVCTEPYEWIPQIQPCAVMKCSALPTWNDVQGNSSLRTYNAAVNYSCSNDKVFEYNRHYTWQTARCGGDGLWTPFLDSCVSSTGKQPFNPTPTEAKGAVAIGTVWLIVFFVAYGLIVVSDGPAIISQLRDYNSIFRIIKKAKASKKTHKTKMQKNAPKPNNHFQSTSHL